MARLDSAILRRTLYAVLALAFVPILIAVVSLMIFAGAVWFAVEPDRFLKDEPESPGSAPPPPAEDDQAVTVTKRYSIWSATGGVTREFPDALGARRVC